MCVWFLFSIKIGFDKSSVFLPLRICPYHFPNFPLENLLDLYCPQCVYVFLVTLATSGNYFLILEMVFPR